MKRIRTIQRDPMGAKPIERRYQRQLLGLLASYKAGVRRMIGYYEGRALEAPAFPRPIDPQELVKSIQQIADLTITAPGDKVAESMAQYARRQGKQWAEKALRGQGILPPGDKGPAPTFLDFFLPADRAAIAKIKQRNLMEIKGMSDEVAKRTTRSLIDGFERRETISLLTRRIDEETEFGRNRATVIARTETMRATNAAATDRYKEAGVEKVQWITGGEDGRTCDECLALHLKIFPIGDTPALPLHPQCRCTTVAVIGSSEEE